MRKNKYIVCSETSAGAICYNALDNIYILLNSRLYNIFKTEGVEYIQINEQELYDLLIRNNFIVENSYYEDKIADLRRLSLKLDKNLYHVVINTTLNCNLNCWYCYENKSTESNLKKDIIELIKKNITFKYEESRFNMLKISFFGGEPLLNFKAIKEIGDFCSSFCQKNSIELILDFTTNATAINEHVVNYLATFKVTFQITLDGHRSKHNEIRFNKKNKKGTYDKIITNINKILDSLKDSYIWIRINFDTDTLKNITDIIEDIKHLDKKRSSIILRKVWQIDINDINKDELFNSINSLIDIGFFVDYHALPRINPCFAERVNQVLVNYDGKIFKCSTLEHFNEANAIGYFKENGQIVFDINRIAQSINYNIEECCKNCNLYPACYGPCGQKIKYKENFRCILENIGMSKEELIIYNFKLKLLTDKIYGYVN